MATTAGTLRTGPTTIHQVRGGGGLALQVREWGRTDGPPILLIHGCSQSHLCWARQYQSALAEEFRLVAYDLRAHGQDRIGAIEFAGAATTLSRAAFGTLIGRASRPRPTPPPTTSRPTSGACAAWSGRSRPARSQPTRSRPCCPRA